MSTNTAVLELPFDLRKSSTELTKDGSGLQMTLLTLKRCNFSRTSSCQSRERANGFRVTELLEIDL